MGQWNTLHIIDEKKLREIIPLLKGDTNFVKKYVEKCKYRIFREPTEEKLNSLIKEIISIANKLTDDFRVLPELKGDLNSADIRSIYYSLEIENFRIIFHTIVFSICALPFPYFKLGYRLIGIYLKYTNENTISEQIIDSIQYYNKTGAIFPGESGIRNWINSTEVETLNSNLDEILPNLKSDEYRSHNSYAKLYTKEIKEFISIAAKNNFGLISCLDPELSELKSKQPIGLNINWKTTSLKENIIYK